jgi:hypothetical protein
MAERDLNEERMDCYQFGTVPSPSTVTDEGLVERLKAISSNVDAFNPDMRMAARSVFDASEQVWKMVPEIINALEASGHTALLREIEDLRECLEEARLIVANLPHGEELFLAKIDAALSRGLAEGI